MIRAVFVCNHSCDFPAGILHHGDPHVPLLEVQFGLGRRAQFKARLARHLAVESAVFSRDRHSQRGSDVIITQQCIRLSIVELDVDEILQPRCTERAAPLIMCRADHLSIGIPDECYARRHRFPKVSGLRCCKNLEFGLRTQLCKDAIAFLGNG
jgi:hypothetical protein